MRDGPREDSIGAVGDQAMEATERKSGKLSGDELVDRLHPPPDLASHIHVWPRAPHRVYSAGAQSTLNQRLTYLRRNF